MPRGLEKLVAKGVPIEKDNSYLEAIVISASHYWDFWPGRGDDYFLARFTQEVGELAGSLVGDHDDPPELEMVELASILLVWLGRRELAHLSQEAEDEPNPQ